MSAFEYNRALPMGTLSIHRLVTAAEGAIDVLRRRRAARGTAKALRALSDHELADLGLVRGEIGAVARSLAGL